MIKFQEREIRNCGKIIFTCTILSPHLFHHKEIRSTQNQPKISFHLPIIIIKSTQINSKYQNLSCRLERLNYERVMAQMLDLTNDLNVREDEIQRLKKQVNDLIEAQQHKERRYFKSWKYGWLKIKILSISDFLSRYEQDAEIRMKLGKRFRNYDILIIFLSLFEPQPKMSYHFFICWNCIFYFDCVWIKISLSIN